jgi:hypothetical protein
MDDTFSITLPVDENGLTDRECPKPDCEGLFKIRIGTGIKDPSYDKCYCPYCSYIGKQSEFFTKEQVKFIESVFSRHVENILEKEFKKLKRKTHSSPKGSFVRLILEYKSSHHPIAYYAEKELETILVCENCTLEYAIYGKFAICPDCGEANSSQILNANLKLVEKLLGQVETQNDTSFRNYLIQNALEDVVSSFDSFGRNSVSLATKNTPNANLSVSFQNIIKAKESIEKNFGFDFSSVLNTQDWKLVLICFQKRHLISHNDGVIDEAYISTTGDKSAIVGRKVSVTTDEVRMALCHVSTLANSLKTGLFGTHKR